MQTYADRKTYRAWSSMKQRCLNPKSYRYSYYGGRGITICDRWLNFESFLEDMGICPVGSSLDRINPNQGYNPLNCRWANQLTQRNNTTKNIWIEHNGERLTASQWVERRTGITYKSNRKAYDRFTKRLYRKGDVFAIPDLIDNQLR